MTVEHADTIDAISTRAETGCTHLTIADHLEWNHDHLVKLQEKLNFYLAFIESGEIYTAYPSAVERPIAINVSLKFRPTPDAANFLAQARTVIEDAGFAFHYGPPDSGYSNDNG